MVLKTRRYTLLDGVAILVRCAPISFILQVALRLLNAFVPAGTALFTASFVDTAVAIAQGQGTYMDIIIPSILLLATVGYEMLYTKLLTFVKLGLQNGIRLKYRTALLEKRTRLEYACIESSDDWDLIGRVSVPKSYSTVEEALTTYASLALVGISMVASIVIVLSIIVSYSWWIAVFITVALVPLVWLAVRSGEKIYDATAGVEDSYRKHRYFNEVLTGRQTAAERAVFGYTDKISDEFKKIYTYSIDASYNERKKRFFRMNLGSIVVGIVTLICIALLLVPTLSGVISFGMFAGLVSAMGSLISLMRWPLMNCVATLTEASKYMADLTKFMAMPEAAGATDPANRNIEPFESLTFKNVTFTYPGMDTPVLKNLSFTINKGGHYSFVGVNGAGKTTITKLITGMYRNYEGEILLNGRELSTYTLAELKAYFVCVFQDFARYQISFRDNVELGSGISMDDAAIEDAAKKAGLSGVLTRIGMDAHLGKIEENGIDISGGEWQRVAMARSIASPSEVKILDEPTAALDPIAESEIYNNFRDISHGRTTIFISHRLGSTKLADTIFVLYSGHVAECGSHDELMEQNGLYAEMFDSQRSWYL